MLGFRNALALLLSAILLILGLMFSVVLLAAVATLGLAAWGYLWWKTQKIRKAAREAGQGGRVIDGEAIVVEERLVRTNTSPPDDAPGQ